MRNFLILVVGIIVAGFVFWENVEKIISGTPHLTGNTILIGSFSGVLPRRIHLPIPETGKRNC